MRAVFVGALLLCVVCTTIALSVPNGGVAESGSEASRLGSDFATLAKRSRSSGSSYSTTSSYSSTSSTTSTTRSTTTTSRNSWFSRMGSSLIGVVIGFLLILFAFPVVTYNEGSYLHRARVLDYVRALLKQEEPVKPGDQVPIHLEGFTQPSEDFLEDDEFGVRADGVVKLVRHVEMYQMFESSESTTEKDTVGGGETTRTTYSITERWGDTPFILTANTAALRDGDNPPFPVEGAVKWPDEVMLREYVMSDSQRQRLTGEVDIEVGPDSLSGGVKDRLGEPMQTSSGLYFSTGGGSPSEPRVGDIRVRFGVIRPAEVSVLCAQDSNFMRPYSSFKHGDFKLPWFCACCCFSCIGSILNQFGAALNEVDLLCNGRASADEMLDDAKSSNKMLLHVVRFAGLLMFILGVYLMFNPIATVFDLIGFLGTIVRGAVVLVAILMGLQLWLLATAFAYLYYRPLVTLFLVVLVGGIYGLLYVLGSSAPTE